MSARMDVIVAGGEEIHRAVFLSHLQRRGLQDVAEVLELADFLKILNKAQDPSRHRSLVVFLGDEWWATDAQMPWQGTGRGGKTLFEGV